MLKEFLEYLQEQVDNHSIYIWGGQGQAFPTVTENWIKNKESGTHRTDALNTYRKAVAAGFRDKLRAFDCSGLAMYWLQNIKGLSKSDMTANGLKSKCKLISRAELKKGDWVFRTYKTGSNKGRAYHIGFVVDDNLNVIEAKGRAYGVVKKPFSSAYWNTYGRPSYFESEIRGAENDTRLVFNRLLKKGIRGIDVKNLQHLLNAAMGAELATDGIFGSKTRKAVRAYQKEKGLKVDGLAGRNTISALGGNYIA